MVACLVQQLFRQKIGKELDLSVVDEVLFPLLRSRKHLSKELLQDIKLTSGILVIIEQWTPTSKRVNVLPFTPIPEYWSHLAPWHVGGVSGRKAGAYPPVGQCTSKFLRKKIRRYNWGTIDILNELRGLNYPQMGYRATCFEDKPGGEFDDAYIRLEEDESLPPDWWSVAERCRNRVAIEGRKKFVNNFMDDVIITGKNLTWEGGVLGWEPL